MAEQEYRISGQTLTNWADTVRGRKGTTDPIPFAELDSEVQTSLQGPTLQDRTVTPSSEQQTITADQGYDGLGTVTVEAAEGLVLTENMGIYYKGKASSRFSLTVGMFSATAVGVENT